MNNEELKEKILELTREYSSRMHSMNKPGYDSAHPLNNPDSPDEINVPYAGRVFNEDEVVAAVSSTLDFWLTLGAEGEALESELASFLELEKPFLLTLDHLQT